MQTAQRRVLDFDSLEDVRRDVNVVLAAPHQTLGNWSGGQICEHLAAAIEVMLDPSSMRPPLWIRLGGPLIRRSFVRRRMKPGFQLPKWAAQYLLPAEVDLDTGLWHLNRSIDRFLATETLRQHPFFGAMQRDQAVALHCRHAELHLSYIVPA